MHPNVPAIPTTALLRKTLVYECHEEGRLRSSYTARTPQESVHSILEYPQVVDEHKVSGPEPHLSIVIGFWFDFQEFPFE